MVGIGNHDYGDMPSRDSTIFEKYFNYGSYKKYDWFGGNYPSDGSKNTYALINASGEDLLMMNLDMCPTDDTLNWANAVIDSYPNRKVIIYDHSYLNNNGLRHTNVCYNLGVAGNDGEDMWNKLVSQHDNIILVISGHNAGSSMKVDYVNGQPITQILADFETYENGGDGYLRILHIYTVCKKSRCIYIFAIYKYISPITGRSI